MLPTFGWQHCQWHCLQKIFLHFSLNDAILPTKSRQHCQDQMIRAIDPFHQGFLYQEVEFFGGKVAKAQIGLNFHWQGKVGDDGHPNS